MEQLSTIESYLQTLEFKKKGFGGCDEEDVFLKIKGLSELYQVEIERLEKRAVASEQRTAEYEKRGREVRQLMAAAQDMKDTMLAKAQADSAQMVNAAERKACEIVDHAAIDSEDIIEKARADAALIVSHAEAEASDIREAASVAAEACRAETEVDTVAIVEKDEKTRQEIKRQTDAAYATAKVAKDALEHTLATLVDLQTEYCSHQIGPSTADRS